MRNIAIVVVALALAACTPHTVREVETVPVAVVHTERAITEAQVVGAKPPTALGPRPQSASAAADALAAKLCEWVKWGVTADAMIQHAAGVTPVPRVAEPMCDPKAR